MIRRFEYRRLGTVCESQRHEAFSCGERRLTLVYRRFCTPNSHKAHRLWVIVPLPTIPHDLATQDGPAGCSILPIDQAGVRRTSYSTNRASSQADVRRLRVGEEAVLNAIKDTPGFSARPPGTDELLQLGTYSWRSFRTHNLHMTMLNTPMRLTDEIARNDVELMRGGVFRAYTCLHRLSMIFPRAWSTSAIKHRGHAIQEPAPIPES